jgi:hypothetical protein
MSLVAINELRVGGIVTLAVAWGTQTRLRCPSCQHFTTGSDVVTCRCGALYLQIPGSTEYLVESLP